MTIIIVPNEPNPNMTGRHYGVAKALSAAGHDVHTLMWDLPHQMNRKDIVRHLFTSLRTRTYGYEDLTLHKIARLPLFWPFINGWLFKRQVRKLYKGLGVDMIFAQSYTNETRIPSELPFIYDLADDYAAPAQIYGSAVYKLAFKILGVRRSMEIQARNALAVTAVSDILVTWAKPFNSFVTKLPNGVETDIITKIVRTKSASKPKPQSLIYVSGFGPWSQPVKVMRAVKNLRKEYPKISLTLVGEGSEVSAIKQFITDDDAASYIEYRGFVHDRAKVFELINQHEIGLNISEKNVWRDAAHPMKVIEYSALGKKVVSTDLAGVQALNQPNIFMFSNDEPDGIEKAIQMALTSSTANYAAISKATLQDYDWKQIESKLEAIIEKAKDTASRPQVVHVTPSYPPALGGLEKVVQILAETQQKIGLKVLVLTSLKPRSNQQLNDIVLVQRFKSFVVANTTIIPGLLGRLLTLSSDKIVHLHVTQAFTPEIVLLAAKLRGFTYVAHVHLDVPATGRFGVVLNLYKQIFLKSVLHGAAFVIVPTEDYKVLVTDKYRLMGDKISVIPSATDHIIAIKPRSFPKGTLHFLSVGRLSTQKNLILLLDAVSRYAQTYNKNFQLDIVGDGELMETLKQRVVRLNLEKQVKFRGALAGYRLENAYKNADAFLLSSVAESFGIVLVEAMTKGLPIVSTDIPAVRNVVQHGKNGLLVQPTPHDFAAAIDKIISDKKLYEKMSINSLKAARHYDWDEINDRVVRLYETAT